ncbi:GNAT family N-acetyltransferase [Halobacillus litoralis]|uniref:GNAT family N-acetyltransferase n=1 Tax=Halobacillus litoralis TaxID=45668 RepID=UPI001CD43D4C|nr:N-acetyltransferase [Halobacillus litoralis]MCA1023753.1 N-acetyltransferase [Halobacillus litoralis]
MPVTIRQEQRADIPAVRKLIERAFAHEEHSDQTEHVLVERLRASDAFIPELSLTAVDDGEVIGYILLTKIAVGESVSLALAPAAVHPERQKEGIGTMLITKALAAARSLGFSSAIVLGHPDYYPRFGFQPASQWGIEAPFDVPEEAFMAVELHPGALKNVNGIVRYSQPFLET